MSRNVDERVVEMQFDNAKFERNVKTSMNSIDQLKQSLDFNGVGSSITFVAQKFSALETVAVGALLRIGSQAVDTGEKLLKSLTVDQLAAGWSKYEQKTASVQTLVNSTGKSIEEINGYLNRLMWFSDETSYSFTDMTAALAQMTSSGGDIDKLMPMITGIANATAFAGKGATEFNSTIRNLTQSYQAGFLQLQDMKSLNLMGTSSKQLKQTFIEVAEEMGKVEKSAITLENFDTTLKDKWADTEVMEVALSKFSALSEAAYEAVDAGQFDTAAEAIEALAGDYDELAVRAFKSAQEAKTFTEAIDATKDAVSSGWLQSFEYIFGNYEEAKVLWTDLANELWDLFAGGAKLRNNILSVWKEAGGRDDLIASFWNIYDAIVGIVTAIREAANDVFKPLFNDAEGGASRLWKLTNRFKQLTESLQLFGEEAEDGSRELNETGQKIKSTFKGVFALLGIVKDVVVAFLKPIKELFSGFDFTSGSVLALTGNLGDFLVNLRATIQESGVLEQITERLGDAFSAVGGFIRDVIVSAQSLVSEIKMGAGIGQGIVDFLFNIVENVTRLIFGLVSALTGKDLENSETKVIGFLNTIRDGFSTFLGAVSPIFKGIADLFSGSFDSIKEAFASLKAIDLKPANDLSKNTEKAFFPLKTFFEGLKKLFGGIAELFKALKPIFSGIISAVGRVLGVIGNALGEIVRNFDFSKLTELLSGGLKVGIGVKIFGFIKSLKKSADSAGGMLDSVKKAFDGVKELISGFGDMMDAKTLNIKSKALKNVAVGVGILAVALFVLSSIEPHKLQASISAITVMVGELVGAMALLGKIDKKANLKQIRKTMVGLAASVLVLSLAIKAVGSLEPEQITNGLLAVTALLAEMVIAAKALGSKKSGDMMKGAKNAIIFAAAVRVLVMSVKALGKMQPEQLVNGLIGVTILIAEMVAAAKILGNSKDASRMMKGAANAVIFAAAVRVLVSSVKSLGKMQPEQLINGMIGITILIVEMVAAAKILGNGKDTSSMMKGAMNAVIFAASLKILVSAVKSLGQMQPDQLVRGLLGMTAVLAEMIAAMKLMSMAKGGAGSMIAAAAGMMVLALALKVLGTLSWEQLGKGLVAVAGAFVILGVAGYVLAPVVGTILALAGAMALMGVSAVLFGAGMLMISAAFAALGGSTAIAVSAIIEAIIMLIEAIPRMASALAESLQEAGTDIIICLVEVAKAALIALKEVVPEAVEVVLELILTTLSSIAENIQPIIEALLDIVVGVINGLASGTPEIITATIGLLKSVIEAIMGAFDSLSVTDLLEASAALALFGVMMGELAVISLLAMVAVLPLPMVGSKLSQFIEAAEPFLTRIQEVDPASLQGAKALAEMILILTANGILDALTSWLTGGSSMVDFGKQLAEFAPYMKQYADGIKGIDSGAVAASANAALALATMASNLPNSGGVVSWFTGDNTLSAFADELIKFGPKLKEYADSVSGLKPAVILNSMIAANAISQFAKNLPNDGGVVSWFTGDNTLSKFGENLAEFGGYLMDYSIAVQGINVSSFVSIIPGLTSLVSIAKDISAINTSSIGTFAEQFIELATNGVDGFANAFTDSTAEISEAVESMLASVLDYISSRKGDYKKAGIELVNQLVAGIKSRTTATKSAFQSTLTTMVQSIRSYRYQFYQAGGYLVEGFAGGIDSNRWKAEAAARVLADKTMAAAREEMDENSPSKKGFEIGDYFGLGMVQGVLNRVKDAASAGKDLASETLDATNAVISRVADYISMGVDTQPTIRPVLDLTDVTTGFNQLGAMFSHRQAVGISARMGELHSTVSEGDGASAKFGNTYNYTQNNYSPKALNASEIYRQTKNQFSRVKGWATSR